MPKASNIGRLSFQGSVKQHVERPGKPGKLRELANNSGKSSKPGNSWNFV